MTAREKTLLAFAGGTFLLWLLSKTEKGQTIMQDTFQKVARGIRNHNPGNIRHARGTIWQGAAAEQNDPAFVSFIDPKWGIRAMAKILKSYASRGIVTIRGIASTWAPSNENDTEAYIKALSKFVGIPDNKPVSPVELPLLIAGMIRQENGTQPYPMEKIREGISLA